MSKRCYFEMYNVVIELHTNSDFIIEEMRQYYPSILRYTLSEKEIVPDGRITLMETQYSLEDSLPEGAVCESFFPPDAIYVLPGDDSCVFFESKDRHLIQVDYVRNQVNCLARSARDMLLPVKFSLKILFNLLLQEKQIFPLHASTIVQNQYIILFCGNSRSGKTMAALTCLERGYSLFSEDTTLFEPPDKLLSFQTRSRIDKKMLVKFPKLQSKVEESLFIEKIEGWYVDLENIFQATREILRISGRTTFIFLNFHNSEASCCEKIDKNKAVAKLRKSYQREIDNSLWWMMKKDDRLKALEKAYQLLLSNTKEIYWIRIGHSHEKVVQIIEQTLGMN